MIIELTESLINEGGLVCPPEQRKIEYCDANHPESKGMYVLVTANGATPQYFYRYKWQGRTAHYRIGTTTDISLEKAREEVTRLKVMVKAGIDPRQEQKQQEKPAEMTLMEFLSGPYLDRKKLDKKSWRDDEAIINLRVKPSAIANKKLSELTRLDIEKLHSSILQSGRAPATANHMAKVLRHALSLGVSWGYLSENPASGIKMFAEHNLVENYMNEAELKRLLTILDKYSHTVPALIFKFLLFTGSRLGECLKAQWKDIDREHRLWRIPAENSKSAKIRSVPLNDAALEVLDQLGTEGVHTHLFVNGQTGSRYTNPRKAWEKIRKEAGLEHVRIHDLRHQYASLLVNSGRTLYEVQQVLGHSDPKVTMRYAHLSTKALQDAANSANEMINKALGK